MKSSIKKKFFRTFFIILIIIESLLLLLSNLFLDDIIISANKVLIRNVYNDYEAYFNLNQVDTHLIQNISNENDIGLVIYDHEEIIACSSLFICQGENPTIPTYISNYFPYVEEDDYASRIIDLEFLNVNQLVNTYNLGNGRYVIFNKSLDSIQEVNQIINQFIQIMGVVVLFIGSLTIYIIGNKITKPIIKINHYANDIAHLKFNHELSVTNQDEIGQLAKNMNLISKKLDIALKELNEKNEILKDDLEKEKELDRKRIKFFSTVSHEFKTPITIIQGYAEGIKHNVVKTKEGLDEYCDIIIDESKKMGSFVNDLLNLSLYESGNFMLSKSGFDFVELIENIKNKFSEAIRDKKIHFEFDPTKPYMINADKYRMEQVVNNLLSNAIKHVVDNGVIKITLEESDEKIKLSIFNNGDKIDEKEISHLWNLFYKLESNKNHIGTGVGLAIVKSIVELHQGSYGVKNVKDGVIFFIEIPKNNTH